MSKEKKIMRDVECPYCETELELTEEEQVNGFICPNCKKEVYEIQAEIDILTLAANIHKKLAADVISTEFERVIFIRDILSSHKLTEKQLNLLLGLINSIFNYATFYYVERVMTCLNELSPLMGEHLKIRTVLQTQNVGGLPFTRSYRRREKIIDNEIAWIAKGRKYPELDQIVPKLKKINSDIGNRKPLTLAKARELSETYDLSLKQISAFYNLSPNGDEVENFGEV